RAAEHGIPKDRRRKRPYEVQHARQDKPLRLELPDVRVKRLASFDEGIVDEPAQQRADCHLGGGDDPAAQLHALGFQWFLARSLGLAGGYCAAKATIAQDESEAVRRQGMSKIVAA